MSGIKWIGELGEDDGEGFESGDELVVEKVVVGDELGDLEVCVDVLFVCLCVIGFVSSVLDCRVGCCVVLISLGFLDVRLIIFGLMIVIVF